MKLPDPLRALCRQIVARHLVEERETFDLCGEQLLDEIGDRSGQPTTSAGNAEFGRSTGDELTFVKIAEAMNLVVESLAIGRKPPSAEDVATKWRRAMAHQGVPAALAEIVASTHAAALHAELVTSTASPR